MSGHDKGNYTKVVCSRCGTVGNAEALRTVPFPKCPGCGGSLVDELEGIFGPSAVSGTPAPEPAEEPVGPPEDVICYPNRPIRPFMGADERRRY